MKERLTGAIILVALIVLLVPELLTGPIHSAPAPQVATTSAEEPPLRSYTIDLADDSHSRAAATSGGTKVPEASGPAQPAPIPVPGTAASGETSAAAAASEWTAESPSAPRQSASDPPASAQSAPSQTPGAQPSAPKSTAGSPAQTEMAPQASVTPPQSSAPSPAISQPAVSQPTASQPASAKGWMVQLGVFASRANADRLAQQLKGKGFKASVSESTGRGRKLYRVRVGPASDRTAAQQLAAKLRAVGLNGAIVPHS